MSLRDIDKSIIGEIWTSTEAIDNLTNLCSFGSRFGGSESERLAVDYMVDRFGGYGVDRAAKEHFHHLGWVRGTAHVSTVFPVAKDYDCISLPHVGTADVTGDLVYVGHGTSHEFDALSDQIRGKIVMINTRSPSYFPRPIHRKEKLGRAIAGGAVGIVFMRWEPGMLPETGSTYHDRECPIPVIGVSREVGEEWRRFGKGGQAVTLCISLRNEFRPNADSWNVVGEIAGRDKPDEIVVVGAHYDGHDIAPGAMDDGAGAAVVMEAARALAMHKQSLKRTVRFCCFGIEEIGLQGSTAYVKAHRDELDRIIFMLNLDGAGRGDQARDLAIQGSLELIPYFRRLAATMNEPMAVDNNIVLFTDCYPFLAVGVPAATCANLGGQSTGTRGFGHTPADTLDKVALRDLQSAAIRVARLILRVANAGDWPAKRMSPDKVREVIGPTGLEVLRLAGRHEFTSSR
ncbi:MAG: M20/M25/M40 family metallo-hydrolase [Bacillota bacterium]|nr:M20/M25/M40 family metallo-hydrolase [Bacillota bacterium]